MEPLRLTQQLRVCWKWAALVVLTAALVLGAAFFVQFKEHIPIGDLTRDPTSVAGVPLYIGFISQLGIFLWASTTTCCLMAALILTRQGQDRRTRNFFLFAAGLSLVLGLDDLFLMHEVFFPYFGVPEIVVFGAYGLLVAAFLALYLPLLLRSEYLLLAMAFGFLGLSVLSDLADVELVEAYLLEDGLKLVGILSWLCYFARTVLTVLAPVPLPLAGDTLRPTSRRPRMLPVRERTQVARQAGGEPAEAEGAKVYAKG